MGDAQRWMSLRCCGRWLGGAEGRVLGARKQIAESLGDATARLAKMMPSQAWSKGSSETDGRARTAPVVGSRNCSEGARVGDGYVKNGES